MDLFDKKKQREMSPEQALQELIVGNERFRSNNQLPRGSLQELCAKASKMGQFPKAVVLSCMDSRSIPEVIFDQSIGDIFTLRVAGHVVNKEILASMEYATKYAGAKLIVIMGHTQCGAVQAAHKGVQGGSLSPILDMIRIAQEKKPDGFVDDLALQHVDNMVQRVGEESATIRKMVANKEVVLVGALYDLKTGVVTFSSR